MTRVEQVLAAVDLDLWKRLSRNDSDHKCIGLCIIKPQLTPPKIEDSKENKSSPFVASTKAELIILFLKSHDSITLRKFSF